MLFAKNVDAVVPIASITKLMTAMVVLDARLDLDEAVAITEDDVDIVKHTRSRLQGRHGAHARRAAAARADGVGEPRCRGARARLSGRHARFRRGDEPEGRASSACCARGSWTAPGSRATTCRPRRTCRDGRRGVPLSAHPGIHDARRATWCTLDNGRLLALQQLERAGEGQHGVAHRRVEDRLHLRGRAAAWSCRARIAAKPVVIVLLDSWGKLHAHRRREPHQEVDGEPRSRSRPRADRHCASPTARLPAGATPRESAAPVP